MKLTILGCLSLLYVSASLANAAITQADCEKAWKANGLSSSTISPVFTKDMVVTLTEDQQCSLKGQCMSVGSFTGGGTIKYVQCAYIGTPADLESLALCSDGSFLPGGYCMN